MLSQFTTAVAGINIENMYNKSRGDFAYSVLDVCGKVDEAAIVAKLSALDGVLKVRVLQ